MSSEQKSPGQAACEAFWAYMGTGPDGQPPTAAWDWARSQGAQGAWMAASQAAVEATEAESARLLEEVTALRALALTNGIPLANLERIRDAARMEATDARD